jgi:hypothetical protein
LQVIERVGHYLVFSGPFQELVDSGMALVRDRTQQAPTFHRDVSEIFWTAHGVSSRLLAFAPECRAGGLVRSVACHLILRQKVAYERKYRE